MVRLFVFGKNNQHYKHIISLAEELEGVNFFFFSELHFLKEAFNSSVPDALLYWEKDFAALNKELHLDDIQLKQIIITKTQPLQKETDSKSIFLSEKVTGKQVYDFLKDTKQQKKDLIYSRDMLDLVIQHLPVAMFWKDIQSRYIGCDQLFCMDCGMGKKCDIYGFTDFNLFPEEQALRNIQSDLKVIETGEPVLNYKEKIINPDGSIDYLNKNKIPIKNDSGEVIMILGLYEKITEQVNLQEHLNTEKQYLQMLMDNIPDTIYFKDRNSRFIKINKAQAAALGITNPDDATGKTDADFFDEQHSEQAFYDEQKLMENGIPLINKLEYLRMSQGYKYVTATKIPLHNDSGECIGMVGVSRDVTKEHQTEEELRQEKKLMNLLMDNIPDFIFFKDIHLKYTRINKSFAGLLKLANAIDVCGKNDHDFFPKDVADIFLNQEKEIFATGKPIVGHIDNFTHINEGPPVYISTTKMPFRDANGNISGIVGISRDVTIQELTRQSYQIAKEKAEEANKAKSLFLANMSHEIRTPMNGVIGMADILKHTKLNPVQKEYLDIIMKSGQTLLTIINDILDFSKIESGKMALESIPINIRNIVEEVADIHIVQAHDKSIDLFTYVDSDVPEFVNGDYIRLKQVITNLVNNAIKFTTQGEVYVSAEYNGFKNNRHEVLFKVKDSGIGIAKEDQNKLFKLFSQVDTSTTRRFGGTGLGLAICLRLVNSMDGKITLDSEKGKGSVFSFTAKFSPTEEQSTSGIQFKNVSFKNLNVLVVDDNRTNRTIFREYLEKWEMNVFEAENGSEALEKLEQLHAGKKHIDIALIDYQMAGMDGIELAQQIKTKSGCSSTQLILLSSVTDAIKRENLKKYGFEYYLNKPVKLKQLFNVIASVIGKPRQTVVSENDVNSCKNEYKNRHFLIVEDNEINMKVAMFSLNVVTDFVASAVNGKEAVDIFNSEQVDYILMDIQMPVMNGIEATMQIRAIEKNRKTVTPVKIIAMTANTMREDIERCRDAGMDAFLGKPFKVADLLNVLNEIS
mgnify:CR=1 FL=1